MAETSLTLFRKSKWFKLDPLMSRSCDWTVIQLFHQNSTLKRSSLGENPPSPNMRVVAASVKRRGYTSGAWGLWRKRVGNFCTAVTDPNLFDTGNLSGDSTLQSDCEARQKKTALMGVRVGLCENVEEFKLACCCFKKWMLESLVFTTLESHETNQQIFVCSRGFNCSLIEQSL